MPIDALRRAARALLSLVLARAEFASAELTLAVQDALRWLLAALGACVLAMLGLVALSAVLVVALWERCGWYTLAVLALLYCAATAILVLRLLRALAQARPLLAETIAELARDGAAIRRGAAPPESTDDDHRTAP